MKKERGREGERKREGQRKKGGEGEDGKRRWSDSSLIRLS